MGEAIFYEGGGAENVIIGHISPVHAMQKNAREQAKKADRARRAMEKMQLRRQNMAALRESQIKRAMLQQTAANTGTLDTSGAEGGLASMQSQLASNLDFGRRMYSLQGDVNRYMRRSQEASNYAQQMQLIGNAATSYFTGGVGGV